MKKLTKAPTPRKPLKKVSAAAQSKPVVKKPLKKANNNKPVGTLNVVKPKQLKTIPKPPPPVLTGAVPVIPPKFKWKGKTDPRDKGFVLVHPDDMPDSVPKPHVALIPNTVWRINKANPTDNPSFLTTMDDGVVVAWSGCVTCLNAAMLCICRRGWIHPSSIEWIYIMAKLKASKDPLFMYGPKMDATQPLIREHGVFHYKARSTGSAIPPRKPAQPTAAPVPQFSAAKPAAPLRKPLRKPLKVSGTPKSGKSPRPVDQVDVRNLDLKTLNASAETAADSAMDAFSKKLGKAPAPKKRLKKKGSAK